MFLQCKSYVNKPVRIRLFNKLLTKTHNFNVSQFTNGVFNTNIDNTFNIFTNVLNVKINKEVIKTKYPIEWNNKEYYLPIEYAEYSIANE